MIVFFFSIKIILTFVTVILLLAKSHLVVLPFFLFVLVDILDGKLLGKKYRIYDTISDRIFVYANFLVFLALNKNYPEIIYMSAFLVRDLLMLGAIRTCKTIQIDSDFFDRAIILATAMVFILRVTNLLSPESFLYELGVWLLATVILLLGIRKSIKVRKGKETG